MVGESQSLAGREGNTDMDKQGLLDLSSGVGGGYRTPGSVHSKATGCDAPGSDRHIHSPGGGL